MTGPDPLAIEGRFFPGLPRRRVPLDELRERLLDRALPLAAVDLVWMHLVTRSRDCGGAWTVACVGVALPALFALAAELCRAYADDHRDIHAAVLTGFLSELATIDLSRPAVLWRLRCAALRAGHLAVREALERPLPSEEDFRSREPARPWGHPDLVLARAVAEGVLTGEQAELIGATRLEPEYTLRQAAAARGVSYKAVHQVRRRAERKLVAWLAEQAAHDTSDDRDVEVRAVHAATVAAAARASTSTPATTRAASPVVTALRGRSAKKTRGRALKTVPDSGVEGCGRTTVAPAHHRSPGAPASGSTSGAPRCA
ncbi:hypothetical protein [Allokutzneria albata]|uniref:hypothetical protein n=1 Tax=Allokutzneria albata TaxID=211114 RepID=UPI000ADEC715|nr:hypothetical protein [Allokutzneria albata]